MYFQKQGEVISGELIHELLNEIDTNRNGQVELDEYLQVCFALFLLAVCSVGSEIFYFEANIRPDQLTFRDEKPPFISIISVHNLINTMPIQSILRGK